MPHNIISVHLALKLRATCHLLILLCVRVIVLDFRYRCSTGHQGISKNCGDLYGRHLDCQWIDVTDVPPGTYQLRLHVNPDRLTPESDYRNNILSCDITFRPSSNYFTVANFKQSGIYTC